MAAYAAWQKRKLAEEWETKKTAHVMALYANTNMDMEENKRPQKIEEIEAAYDAVVDAIYNGVREIDESEMSEDEVSFMRAAKRGQERILPPVMPGEETIANLPE